jgi:hypothetical protein
MGTRGSFPGVKQPGRDADHSPPPSAEVKECVELYLHSPNTPSWHGAQLKHRDNFTFTSSKNLHHRTCSVYFPFFSYIYSKIKSRYPCHCFPKTYLSHFLNKFISHFPSFINAFGPTSSKIRSFSDPENKFISLWHSRRNRNPALTQHR